MSAFHLHEKNGGGRLDALVSLIILALP